MEVRLGSLLTGGRAVGRADKIQVRWEGMCQGTGQAVEDGGGVDADPFWYLQYPERTEHQFLIGVAGGGEIQCGCGCLPGDKTDRRHIHKGVVRLQVCRNVGA